MCDRMRGRKSKSDSMSTILLFSLYLLFDVAIFAVVVFATAKIFQAPRATLWSALAVAGVRLLITSVSLFAILAAVVPNSGSWLPNLAWVVIGVASMIATVRLAFGLSWTRATGAGILSLIAGSGLSVALSLFVIQPLFVQSFTSTASSMSPTVLGKHREAPCPRCRGTLVLRAIDPRFRHEEDPWGICQQCRKVSRVDASDVEHPADRFFINRRLAPERWDIIVFRYPEEEQVLYVKRLIGMPGEEVFIRDGAIWINGVRQTPPSDLQGLEWVTEFPEEPGARIQGDPDHPAHLGPDEFFVLGDFSQSSSDSRFWGAVPRRNIEGVVTVIYWPSSRARILK